MGLKVNTEYDEDTSKENGIVLKQSTTSGTVVDEGTTITITVNRVAESKDVTLTIDVKKITGGYAASSASGNNTTDSTTTSTPKTVNITITDQNNPGTNLWTASGQDKNNTVKATVTGRGQMTLTVTLTDSDGGNWTRQVSVNFNSDTTKSVS